MLRLLPQVAKRNAFSLVNSMSLIAILSARAPVVADSRAADEAPGLRALLPFGGATFLEHQARQAIEAGARTILIHVDAIPPALSRIIEKIGGREDVTAEFIREMPIFGAHVGPDDRVLCLADGILVPQDALAALASGVAPRLLVTPYVAETNWLERVDAQDAWAGAALLPGQQLLGTIDLLGEWDLMSTLVRVAIQNGAGRLVISPEKAMNGQLTQIAEEKSAGLALETLTSEKQLPEPEHPGFVRKLIRSGCRMGAVMVVRRQIDPQRLVLPAVGAAGIAVVLGLAGWSIAAWLVSLAAYGALGVAREAGAILLHVPLSRWPQMALDGAALLLIAILGFVAGNGDAFVPVAILLSLGLLMLVLIRSEGGYLGGTFRTRLPLWTRIDVPTALIIMAFGSLVGLVPLAFGLIGALAIAQIALWAPDA